MGMSKSNEIYKLSALVKPHIGIITNVSEAHLENFRNIEGIAKAKSEIIYNIQKGGTIILNRDDKFFNYFEKIAEKKRVRVRSFGYSKKSNIKFINIKKINNVYILKVSIDKSNIILKVKNNNKNYIMNILCSLAILKELNLDMSKVRNFLKHRIFKG